MPEPSQVAKTTLKRRNLCLTEVSRWSILHRGNVVAVCHSSGAPAPRCSCSSTWGGPVGRRVRVSRSAAANRCRSARSTRLGRKLLVIKAANQLVINSSNYWNRYRDTLTRKHANDRALRRHHTLEAEG